MGLSCECPLRGTAEVRYRGDTGANIIFVGESPGAQEIREGSPFVGPSGRLLTQELHNAGIDPDTAFYTNAARCRIDKDSMTAREIKSTLNACRPFLETAFNTIKPKVIVVLGAIALEQVLRMKGIKKARGKWQWSEEFKCYVLPMWHPAYILRNQAELENFKIDMTKLARFKADGFVFEDEDDFIWREVDTILPLLNGGLMKENGNINPAFHKEGIRAIRTGIVDDGIPYVTAIDTETQGVKWYDPNSIVLSYSIAVGPNEGWQIYLQEECSKEEADFLITVQRGGTKKKPLYEEVGIKRTPGFDRKVRELKELCRRPDIKIYFANQKYDKHRLYELGITEINSAPMDVMLAAHAIDSERFLNNTLNQLIESFTDLAYNYKGDLSEAEKGDMLDTIKRDRSRVSKYAAFDAVGTLHVALALKRELIKDEATLNYFVRFVQPVETELLFDIERNGVLIDVERLPVVKKEIRDVMARTVARFRKICPGAVVGRHDENFKLTRRVILMEALFDYSFKDKEGIEVTNRFGFHLAPLAFSPKTGLPVCDKDVMQRLLDSSSTPDRAKELIHVYREWSDHHTLMTRYIKNIEMCIGEDGRMHPTYSFKFTSSGRTGARDPSIQNFPKRGETAHLIRSLIIAPPGKKLLEVDHSMSELRWVAHVADERRMKEIFQKNGDIHLYSGVEITEGGGLTIGPKAQMISELISKGIDGAKIKAIRQNAKAVNFGLIYGMSANKLRLYARTSYNLKLSKKDSDTWRNKFFNLYMDLPTWHKFCKSEIEGHGFIRHVFGRKRTLPNVNASDKMVRAEAIRIGTNFVIQGPSSDATLMGGEEVRKHPQYNTNEAALIVFMHDALIYEVDEDLEVKYARMVTGCMENIDTEPYGFQLTVPLVGEAESGFNLAEMKELEL